MYLNSGKSREYVEGITTNENNVNLIMFSKQFNRNVIVNVATISSCQNMTFLCVYRYVFL